MSRVLIVENYVMARESLAAVVRALDGVVSVTEAGTVGEAVPLLSETDFAVIDLELPDGSATELVSLFCAANPDGQVLVLTGGNDRRVIARAFEAGAVGVIYKSASSQVVANAIRQLQAGEAFTSPLETIEWLRIASRERERERATQLAFAQLTNRERDVLRALAQGWTDREIGLRLHISTDTVRTHMVNLLGKLGVKTRLHAVVFALRHGAITLDEWTDVPPLRSAAIAGVARSGHEHPARPAAQVGKRPA